MPFYQKGQIPFTMESSLPDMVSSVFILWTCLLCGFLFSSVSALHSNDWVPQRTSTPPLHLLGKSVILSVASRSYKGNLTLGSWIPRPLRPPPGPTCSALQISARRWQQRAPKRVFAGACAQLLAGARVRGLELTPSGIHTQLGRSLKR